MMFYYQILIFDFLKYIMNFLLLFFDSKHTVFTWLGCSTKNILNLYCIRNGGTPVFALKWVCRTDTSVELLHSSNRAISQNIFISCHYNHS